MKIAVILDHLYAIKDEAQKEISRDSHEAPDEPHGMGAIVRGGTKTQTRTPPLPKTREQPSSGQISEVPEARAVVVLYVHFKSGEVRRSHGFCIDNKQGILVAGAHTLPLKLQGLVLIEVHLYNSKENRFAECFVAELLPGGISSTFQRGGMDLALLRITHHYDGKATDKCGKIITDVTDIEKRLSGMPIGSDGYEPRDQVSVIRFPIIKADNSRGCKPKCGRVVACVGSRLHLDFTELQDGDSGSLVVNGAGEAIAFLMGRPPNREPGASACSKANSDSTNTSTPDNSIYYAQLLGAEESQAFIQNVLLWNRLNQHLSTNAPVPWGEYKIKQRIRKLEQVQGLTSQQQQQVAEFMSGFEHILAVRRKAESHEEQARILKDAECKANEAIGRLEAAKKAAEMQDKSKQRLQDKAKEEAACKLKAEVKQLQAMCRTIQTTLTEKEEHKASESNRNTKKEPECKGDTKAIARAKNFAFGDANVAHLQAKTLHKMQALVDQIEAQRHTLREEREANVVEASRLEVERAKAAHAHHEEVLRLEFSQKASQEAACKAEMQALSLEKKREALEIQRKTNDTTIQVLKTERASLFEDMKQNEEISRANKEEALRLHASREAHQEAAHNAKNEAAHLGQQREALETERKANETTIQQLKAERDGVSIERKANEKLMRKTEDAFTRLKAEREAHQEAAHNAKNEAAHLDQQREALRVERQANETTIKRLETERWSPMEASQLTEEVAYASASDQFAPDSKTQMDESKAEYPRIDGFAHTAKVSADRQRTTLAAAESKLHNLERPLVAPEVSANTQVHTNDMLPEVECVN